ncbi:ImmA/IrrE family metallo-endopeptidase [Escherichia coli]|uniref:ImmA/IrrE family metallo-endopeptidase n=1 Tax=Escherichia coli TaxID=562 RepID=UPI000543EDE3|nr:ImmA/IrrE family metallo-endopeptidase [Escherichia coli]EEW6222758.1 ImmA/IrrE family metallo-endopeptidase [Escherichia coli]EEW6415938.1 ImmA/IrrE family metallo-endopeptidase [Escherichia coli]EEX2508837.1 ImmA/IrrE family metallo-endopeptidase [Escherichia coli]EFA4857872.1 ImmA/IrrE family metallo-endopeptidase [Escherichia coli]EFA4942254.1 ImmA/IrrE family metallo-endopeptidase [Escherichia coli]
MAILRRKNVNPKDVKSIAAANLTNPESVIRLANSMGITIVPFDLEMFIAKLGIRLNKIIMENDISGKLEKNENGVWEITVNALHHPRRQRFTLAHELGHYFLHRNQSNIFKDKSLYRGKEMTSMEYEANNFAGAILMPRDELVSFLGRSSDIDLIADYFNVSALAAKIRVEMIKRDCHAE